MKALLKAPRKTLDLGSSADEKPKCPASDYRYVPPIPLHGVPAQPLSFLLLRRSYESDGDESECYDVQLTYPLPPCSSDVVTITRHDISRLKPEQYLNDNIIDYYFKYDAVQCFVAFGTARDDVGTNMFFMVDVPKHKTRRLMLEEYGSCSYIQQNVLFLSSHFYSRLRMGKGSNLVERLKTGYKNVATWVTRTDFFSRSMIFIPINKE